MSNVHCGHDCQAASNVTMITNVFGVSKLPNGFDDDFGLILLTEGHILVALTVLILESIQVCAGAPFHDF